MEDFWNEKYNTEEYLYGTEPNEFFRTFIDSLPPGKLLLPGAGEGRNAVYAAEAGWEVDAFDISSRGREKALRLARENDVNIQYSLQDLNSFDCKKEYYDVVALIFLHLPPAERKEFHKRISECLKNEGGNLYLLAFSKEQLNYTSGGPEDEESLYTREMMMEDFRELQIDLLQEDEVTLSEGEGHKGPASVIKMRALKINVKKDSDHLTF